MSAVVQLTREELAGMSPEAIVKAQRAGQLQAVLGGQLPPDPSQPITDRATLRGMTADEIVKAQNEGRLDGLLGIERSPDEGA